MTDKPENERGELVKLTREQIEDFRHILKSWKSAGLTIFKSENDPLADALCDMASAALSAQPQGEPVAISDDDGKLWFYKVSGAKNPFPAGTLFYTAPQSGVREGMLKEALHVLVELKKIKRRIEAGIANDAETRYYNAMKESAWLGAESALSAEAITRAAEQINAEGRWNDLAAVDDSRRNCEAAAPSAPPSAATVSVAVEERDYKELWLDLIMQVGNKYPGESRHDTAKRYIINAETYHDSGTKCAAAKEPK